MSAVRPITLASLTTAFFAIASTPSADTLNGDSYVTGRLCVGADCIEGEGFGEATLKLKQTVTRLTFEDTSSSTGFPANIWQLWVNDDFENGLNRFTIRDRTGDTMPFTVEAGAPENAMWIDETGFVGLGTSLPQAPLHISHPNYPAIHFDRNGALEYIIAFSTTGGAIIDETRNKVPYQFAFTGFGLDYYTNWFSDRVSIGGSLAQALLQVQVHDTGDFALNISDSTIPPPSEAYAYIHSENGRAQLRVDETNTTTTPRTLLNLQNNGRPEIVMGNSGTNGEWSFGAGTNFVLKTGPVGSLSADKIKAVTFKPNGDLDIEGVLTTAGGTCGRGCDLVFTEGYDLPSIQEHSKKMWELGYLPNVGPTKEGAPINVSDKLGRMLNELEHAHIYISQLEKDVRRLPALEAQNKALNDRLSALEAKIEALAKKP